MSQILYYESKSIADYMSKEFGLKFNERNNRYFVHKDFNELFEVKIGDLICLGQDIYYTVVDKDFEFAADRDWETS